MFTFRKIQKILNVKRPIRFETYGGAQWFNLTREAVSYILAFIENNKAFMERFKYTRASDEIFFQTILMAFDYPNKSHIIKHHLRYFDWKTGPTYPRILTIDDYDKFIHSRNLFARKFDEKVDSAVIDKLLEKEK